MQSARTTFLLALIAVAPLGARPSDDPVDVDIKNLTEIEWKVGDPLPETVTKLDGKKVRISGLMDPNQFTPDDVYQFDLVSNTCGCSGSGPQHYVKVDLGETSIPYQTNPIELIGTISIGEVKDDDGFVTSIYRLNVEKIVQGGK